jgi:hypothetical protein
VRVEGLGRVPGASTAITRAPGASRAATSEKNQAPPPMP